MLTVEFDRLHLNSDTLFLDAGSGFGRHAYEAARRGARVVALDYASEEVATTLATFAAMAQAGEINADRLAGVIRGDATNLPFRDSSFGCIIASEMLEHVPDDVRALSELSRVLRPGGTLAATVPSWFPEKINWMLSDQYHSPFVPGGHVRIYTASDLKSKIRASGLAFRGAHRAHGLHSPYWWLRCAVGPARQDHRLVNAYKKFLEWEIISGPRSIRILDKALSPILGKSYVVYSQKPFATKVIGS